MNESERRSAYLQALGIDQWISRRAQAVVEISNQQADWMVVGDLPSAEEDQGEPFSGAARQLLDAMLAAIEVSVESVLMMHSIPCRHSSDHEATGTEAHHGLAYWQQQIERVRPRIILAFGSMAAQSLLGTDLAIGELRGRVHEWGAQKLPLVVTYHPAHLLQNPGDKRKAWEDLKLARSAVAQR